MISYHPPFTTFDQFLKHQAQKHPRKSALAFDRLNISYSQLDQFTAALAHQLLTTLKLKPSHRFSFAFQNSPEVILLNYAAWRAGLVTVPLDTTRDTLDRKIYKLKFTNSKLLFTRPHPQIPAIKKALPSLQIIQVKDFPDFNQKFLNQSGHSSFNLQSSALDQDCLILFTSGTTALPKGVRLTLTNLFANAESIADWMRFTSNDRFLLVLPLHHIHSTTFANTTLLVGGTLILTSKYSKSNFWSVAARHQATVSSIVPTIAYDLLSETVAFKKYRSKIKFSRIQIGSAPVQPTVVEKFIHLYHIPLIQGYGQTETSLRSTGVPMDLTQSQYHRIIKLNSLGCELKYTNVTILGNHRQELPPSKVGDICVRGPIIMKGYLKNPQATQPQWPKINDDCQKSAEVQSHVKKQPLVGNAKNIAGD